MGLSLAPLTLRKSREPVPARGCTAFPGTRVHLRLVVSPACLGCLALLLDSRGIACRFEAVTQLGIVRW